MRTSRIRKRNYRKSALVILFVAIMVWLVGCAASQTISLSALVSPGDKGTLQDQGDLTANNGEGGILISVTEPDSVKGSQLIGANGNGNGHGIYIPDGKDSSHIDSTTDDGGVDEKGKGEVSDNGNESANDGNGNEKGNGEASDNGNSQGQEQGYADETALDTEKQKSGEKKKVVALTFDDGPDTRYTTEILDILKEEGVQATFFVVGSQVEKYPEVLQRIEDEGHGIANHSFGHENFRKLSRQQIIDNIDETDKAIKEVLGYSPKWFRAPYGALSQTMLDVLEEQEREHTGWTVDTRDWAGTSVKDMREMIRNETKPGGIILMHSFGGKHIKNTVEMLPGAIKDLREMGYEFVTMDELDELDKVD